MHSENFELIEKSLGPIKLIIIGDSSVGKSSIIIKYTEIAPNSPIKQIKDPIGFLIIITVVPKNKAIKLTKSKNSGLNPLFIKSDNTM